MNDTRQKDLFGAPQPDLFEEGELPQTRKVFRVNPEHVRQWFHQTLLELRDYDAWPWEKSDVEEFRAKTWEKFALRLGDVQEAKNWLLKLNKEAERLDAATGWGSTAPPERSGKRAA